MVHDAAGRADDAVDAAFEGLVLDLVAGAAVDAHDAELAAERVLLELVRDLESQFTRGGKDERLNVREVGVVRLNDGQPEGRRLSGPGAGLADDVDARQEKRDGLLLDRCRVFEADAVKRSDGERAELQVGKRGLEVHHLLVGRVELEFHSLRDGGMR